MARWLGLVSSFLKETAFGFTSLPRLHLGTYSRLEANLSFEGEYISVHKPITLGSKKNLTLTTQELLNSQILGGGRTSESSFLVLPLFR